MSWRRAFGSRSRQRRTSRAIAGGVAGGSALSPESLAESRQARRTSSRRRTRVAREHLEQNRAERPESERRVTSAPRACSGLMYEVVPINTPCPVALTVVWCRIPVVGGIQNLGDAEIEHLDRAVQSNLDVGRLEIAMNDALLVGRFERVGDLSGDFPGPGRAAAGPWPGDSGRVWPSTSSRTSAGPDSDSARPWMAAMLGWLSDARSWPRAETGEPGAVAGHLRGQDLQRDLTPEVRVSGAIHLAHASLAKRRDDLVLADPGPGGKRHGEEGF